MKRLFVDTSGWMAMTDAKDPLHDAAITSRDQWLEQGGRLLVSNYIVDETLTLIRMRLGLDAAEQWLDFISRSPRCKTEWITPELEEKAARWFFKWRDQTFSFTDCTSFALMREYGIKTALTADKHFTIAGFNMIPASP